MYKSNFSCLFCCSYCIEHARRASMLRQKASRKRRPKETPETLLEQIEHYGTKTDNQTGRDLKRLRPSIESLTNRLLGIFNGKASLASCDIPHSPFCCYGYQLTMFIANNPINFAETKIWGKCFQCKNQW